MKLAIVFMVCLMAFQIIAAERLLTKMESGSYFAVPNMGKAPNIEESSFSSPMPFKKGILTGGKKTYSYWETLDGFIFFKFDKPFNLSRIKINLKAGDYFGTDKIHVAGWRDIQAALRGRSLSKDVEKFEIDLSPQLVTPTLEITATDRWNEIKVDVISPLIMLKFKRLNGKRMIAVSEVEIWGDDVEEKTECNQFNEYLNGVLAKENAMRAKLENMPNLAYSGNGTKCWTTLLPWPGITSHQADCVINQKDGNMSQEAQCFQTANYWAACSPATQASGSSVPQVLYVNLSKPETFTVSRLVWASANDSCKDYSLEYFADGKWKLLYHDNANTGQVATYQFKPIVTDKLRLTMYEFSGQARLLMRSFQLYNPEGSK